MNRIVIELFGTPAVYLDGRTIYIRRRKALALLVYLATSQRTHGRDVLAALFWPEQPQQTARSNLRRAIFSLHRRLGPDALQVDGGNLSLPVGADLTVDVVEFRRRIESIRHAATRTVSVTHEQVADLEHVIALYQDDFARSLSLADCPEFEEWQRAQTDWLRADLIWALSALADAYTQAAAFDLAIGHARRLLELDPYADEALQRLMRLYAVAGQTAAAIRLYERHAQLLAQELGLPPGQDAQQLYEQLRTGAIPAQSSHAHSATTPSSAQTPQGSHRWSNTTVMSSDAETGKNAPFVAREFALAALGRSFAAAHSGHGQVIFVAGEAGSGKTTLLEEFARRARRQHPELIVASGACTTFAGAGEPLQPFVEILRRLTGISLLDETMADTVENRTRQAQNIAIALQAVTDHGANLVGRVIPHSAMAEQTAATWQPGRLASAVPTDQSANAMISSTEIAPIQAEFTAVLQHIAEQRTLLLVLDDLQWSDPSTASLLYHLARRISRCRILIVGAYRPEEVSWNSNPLGQVLEELQQHYGPIRISLDLQAEAEARHFVDALLDSERNRLNESFRRDLFHHSRGHALFTVELVRQMQETGHLFRDQDGYWVQSETVDWSVLPSKVEASIARRFHRLSPALYRMLAVASVEGEQFSAEVLAQVLGMDAGAVITQLGLLGQQETGLVAGVGIERTGSLGLSRYRFRHNLFQQYVYHALDATERQHLHEQVGRAIEALYIADTDALSGVAAALANHFDQAEAIDAASRYHLLAGRRAVRMSAYTEASDHLSRGLSEVRALPASQRSAERELELVQELSAPLGILIGYGHPELNALYTEAFQLASQVKDRQKVFRTVHGIWRYWGLRSEMKQTRQLADELLAIAEEQQQANLQMEARRAQGITAFHLGELKEAGTWLSQCLALYDPIEHAAHIHLYGHDPGVSATGYLAHVRWLEGDADAAIVLAAEAVRLAEELDHPFSLAHALGFAAGDLSKFLQRPDQVLAITERLNALTLQHSYPMWIAISEMLSGWARAAQGQYEDGITQLQSGLDAWQAMGNRALLPYYVGLLAEAYILSGDRLRGLETVNHALELVEQTSDRWWEPELRRLREKLM